MGTPLRLILTGGQVSDVTQGPPCWVQTMAVTADKEHDSDELVERIESTEACANIPPRCHWQNKRPVDWCRYKAQHLGACFFNRRGQFRRTATQYDNLPVDSMPS